MPQISVVHFATGLASHLARSGEIVSMTPNKQLRHGSHATHNSGITSEQVFRSWLEPLEIRLRGQRKVSTLADGTGAESEVIEDLQGALVNGRHNPGRHSIKSRAEMFVGF
jgi:hypothetical protein